MQYYIRLQKNVSDKKSELLKFNFYELRKDDVVSNKFLLYCLIGEHKGDEARNQYTIRRYSEWRVSKIHWDMIDERRAKIITVCPVSHSHVSVKKDRILKKSLEIENSNNIFLEDNDWRCGSKT